MTRRRLRRALSWALVAAGLLLLADAVLTVAWKEPVTALLAEGEQRELERDLRRLEARPLPAPGPEERAPPRSPRERRRAAARERRRVAALARALDRQRAPGAAIGRLRIPRLRLDAVVVHGSAPVHLRRGPGTIDGAPLPGARGTAAIAGHRTTYGAPFGDIDRLRRGDEVEAVMPYAAVRYSVVGRRIVRPDTVEVLRRRRADSLVLVACHPRFSVAKRIVVTARLVGVRPRGRVA